MKYKLLTGRDWLSLDFLVDVDMLADVDGDGDGNESEEQDHY